MTLPELTQGWIDTRNLETYFGELEQYAQVRAILPKGWEQGFVAAEGSASIAEARELIADAGIRGLQLHYRYDGEDWCDTLLKSRDGDGTRLVRIKAVSPSNDE